MDFIAVRSVTLTLPVIILLGAVTAGNQAVLIIASLYLLYMHSALSYYVILAMTALNLLAGVMMQKTESRRREIVYLATVSVDVLVLGVLCFYSARGLLPAVFGISYYTFKAVSMLTDLYRKKLPHVRIDEMLLYLLCFTQLTCGPLSRTEHFLHQNARRGLDRISEGLVRFMTGYCKKILLADSLTRLMGNAVRSGEADTAAAWLCSVCYSLALYYDFSGYSDMAIGLTGMLGFDCPENFDDPYMTTSVSEFWRRWHITLGAWFRDYVYIPMGGSRVGKLRLVLNLLAVWLLTGLWHGIEMHFVLWAMGYFVLIVFEKLSGYPTKFKSAAAKLLYRIGVLLFVNFQWVMFRAKDVPEALSAYRVMLIPAAGAYSAARMGYLLSHYGLLLTVSLLLCFPVEKKLRAFAASRKAVRITGRLLLFALFICALGFTASGASNPFAYANF